mmetsp:Transcript_29827/g.67464  ORF Transcript_29827/g.67464 Transcript_29827/m.67464 type:complete len:145 (-) Transcript_29827:351-785(-)
MPAGMDKDFLELLCNEGDLGRKAAFVLWASELYTTAPVDTALSKAELYTVEEKEDENAEFLLEVGDRGAVEALDMTEADDASEEHCDEEGGRLLSSRTGRVGIFPTGFLSPFPDSLCPHGRHENSSNSAPCVDGERVAGGRGRI